MTAALDASAAPPLPYATFDHVAMAAPRIRDLLPLYRDLLGGVFTVGGDNPEVGWRVARLAYTNGEMVELMEPLAGSHFFDSFFARTGGGGAHHLTFTVPDIRVALEDLRAGGFEVRVGDLDDPVWREVFVHPRTAHGVLLQIVEKHVADGNGTTTLDDILAGRGHRGTGVPSP
jgi:methylmalonyl-CoA/ethylmalonyl-CoA epimerase